MKKASRSLHPFAGKTGQEVPAMKNKHICPKCGSHEIILVPGKSDLYGIGNNIQVGMSIFSAVLVDRFVCCSCGYSEEWINKEDIAV